MAIQKTGATIASEKFSARLSIAARATPAASSACGVAADDVRDCGAAGGDAAVFERGRHVRDVPVQASLRDQRAGDEAGDENPERQAQQRALARPRQCAPTMPSRISTATMPAARAALAVLAVSRLSHRSSASIRRPIQVTGWPIARCKRSG